MQIVLYYNADNKAHKDTFLQLHKSAVTALYVDSLPGLKSATKIFKCVT